MGALTACGGETSNGPASPVVEAGRAVAARIGCVACHGAEGEGVEGLGPAWQGLFRSSVGLTDGRSVTVDRAYLERSVVEPDADVVAGFTLPMPPYKLDSKDLDALLDYIEELQ
jgi:cytochrome c oxidase subunit 2